MGLVLIGKHIMLTATSLVMLRQKTFVVTPTSLFVSPVSFSLSYSVIFLIKSKCQKEIHRGCRNLIAVGSWITHIASTLAYKSKY